MYVPNSRFIENSVSVMKYREWRRMEGSISVLKGSRRKGSGCMFKIDFAHFRSLLKVRPGKEMNKTCFLFLPSLPHGFPLNSSIIWIM